MSSEENRTLDLFQRRARGEISSLGLVEELVGRKQTRIERKPQPKLVAGRTLEQVVIEYLAELDNPAPDATMRNVYRDWMAEHVGVERMKP